jgi:protein-L-isoaspartate(D-aspartate) O-methyltransferase
MDAFAFQRAEMVETQLRARGIVDERVLEAFGAVPRHAFVPDQQQDAAYTDHPLPIGDGQTISQPYIVALMISSLRLKGGERVLEVGAGSGYGTAILSLLAKEVYAVERLPQLLHAARGRLEALGYERVHWSLGNGSLGWPEHAPYQGILVSAAAPELPPPLAEQLAEGGWLVLPVGPPDAQTLIEAQRRGRRLRQRAVAACSFVPLLGAHGWAA